MLKIVERPVLRQYAAVIIANLSIINLGLSAVWASPMLIKFRDVHEGIFSSPPTEEQEAWITSISLGACSLVLPFTGFLLNCIGSRNLLCYMFMPRLAMCALKLFATEVWMILLARSLAGVSDGVSLTAMSTYAAEISSKNIRGSSGTVTQLLSAIGVMIMFGVGPFVSYLGINLLLTCVMIATFIPLLFVPESPYFLHAKGRTQEAVQVLVTLRGTEELAYEEIKEYSTNPEKDGVKISLFKNKVLIKTFIFIIFLGLAMQLIGYHAVNFYLQTILESTQTSISSQVSSLIVGVIQLVACVCTFLLTDRFGRKPLLCISLLGLFIGQVGLGTFFIYLDGGSEITGFLNFLPLLSIAITIYGYNAGMGSLLFILVAELFEGPVRPYAVSCAIFTASTSTFIGTLFFPALVATFGAAAIFYSFAVGCLVSSLVIFVFVPETKGKTFAEIQKALGSKDP